MMVPAAYEHSSHGKKHVIGERQIVKAIFDNNKNTLTFILKSLLD